MSGMRQKIQYSLALEPVDQGETPVSGYQGTEPIVAKPTSEKPGYRTSDIPLVDTVEVMPATRRIPPDRRISGTGAFQPDRSWGPDEPAQAAAGHPRITKVDAGRA